MTDNSQHTPSHIRSYDEMLIRLRDLTKGEADVHPMRHRRISRHMDAVDWAAVHWKIEFQFSVTYHTHYFDISSMSFLRRYQYRCLSMYEESPAVVEQRAKDKAVYLIKEYKKMYGDS